MQASPAPESGKEPAPLRRRVRPAAIAAGAALVAAGALAFGGSNYAPPALAQFKPDASAQIGRAPLSFADVVDRVKPAVVSISVVNGGDAKVARNDRRPSRPFEGLPDLPDDHPLNEFFKNLPKEFRGFPSPRPTQAQGSGFLVSADGYVVTNNHVIDGAAKIQVSFDDQEKLEAEMIGTDPRTDVALLKIKGSKKTFPYVKFATKPARVGDWVIAVGNPFGLGGTVTAGIVSALTRDIGSGPYDYMQIDAAVNRGNSGGPTFNIEGEVIGVNTAIYSPSGGNVGIAFAVPARTAAEVVEQLKSTGSVNRGWLGVKIQNLDDDVAASLGLNEAKGALVTEVTANGPAAGSGLKAQDAILQVNGDRIEDSRGLARKIAEMAPDSTVDVKVWRNGKEQVFKVKLGTFPSGKELTKLEQGKPTPNGTELEQLGLTLMPARTGEGSGVVIAEVESGSDAEQKGLKAGDVILEVGGQNVGTPDEVIASVKKIKDMGRKAVLLNIKSGEQTRFVALQFKKG